MLCPTLLRIYKPADLLASVHLWIFTVLSPATFLSLPELSAGQKFSAGRNTESLQSFPILFQCRSYCLKMKSVAVVCLVVLCRLAVSSPVSVVQPSTVPVQTTTNTRLPQSTITSQQPTTSQLQQPRDFPTPQSSQQDASTWTNEQTAAQLQGPMASIFHFQNNFIESSCQISIGITF